MTEVEWDEDDIMATGIFVRAPQRPPGDTALLTAELSGRIVAAPPSPSWDADEPDTAIDTADDIAAQLANRWVRLQRSRRRRPG